MKNLIIVGAGGMGRSVYCIATGSKGYGVDFVIKGFIDDDLKSMDGFDNYSPLLSTINDYVVKENDVFVCSIGNTKVKRQVCDIITAKGGQFMSLIHKTAIVRNNSIIGEGTVVADYASVGADCKIGSNCLVQSYSIVAHDCAIGDFVRIDTHSVCVGGVVVKNGAMIHTGSVLSHNVVVGENATVGAMSFVIKRVKDGATVFGSPAKMIF